MRDGRNRGGEGEEIKAFVRDQAAQQMANNCYTL